MSHVGTVLPLSQYRSGVLSVEEFRKTFRLSRLIFILVNLIILAGNLMIIYWELFKPTPVITKVNASAMFSEFMALLVCFLVTGPILFNGLVKFYEKKYET